ncbi:ankyrin-2 [Fusarium pseudocircinatum]|uniref:Ankyrin-2 n=1 Tax=Fusarium pseudocircinatum TaxID=56676 RepID=A0A8H5PAM0_9HYPO|nr:ankyrin-2 [Fusarium pseudocircinatum]
MDRNSSLIVDVEADKDFDVLSFVESYSERHEIGHEMKNEEYRKQEEMRTKSAIEFVRREATDENGQITTANPHPKLSIAHDLVSFLLSRKAATSYLFRRHPIPSGTAPQPFPLNIFMGKWTSWTIFALSKSKDVQPGTRQCCQLMKPGDIEVITVSNDKFVQLMSLLTGDELLMMSTWEMPDASRHKNVVRESLLGEFTDSIPRTTWTDWDIAFLTWFGRFKSPLNSELPRNTTIMFIHWVRAIVFLVTLSYGSCKGDVNGLSFPTRKVAGISVINTPIVQDAEAFALKHSTYPIYKHVMRSWLYGVLMINANETLSHSIDLEVHAVATLLHDLGWDTTEASPMISADRRFEVDGAFAARAFLREHQDGRFWHERNVQLVWDAIALHTERSISYFKELDVQVVSKGIAMDFLGPAYGVSREDYAAITKAFPKSDLKDSVNDNIIWLCDTKPQTTYGATGKTFITSNLVSRILDDQILPNTGAAVYHFGRHELQFNLADYSLALRSITRQLVSQLPENSTLAAEVLETIEDGLGDAESTMTILQMLASAFCRIVIILDGVDSSNEAGLHELIKILLEEKTQLRIMLTSRGPPSQALSDAFGIDTITARATDQDLSLYHAKAMDEAPVSAEVLDEVLDDSHATLFPYQKLMEMADGRFLPIIPTWFSNIASRPNADFLSLVESWSPNSSVGVSQAFCRALVNEIQASKYSEITLCSLYYLVYGEENGYTFTPSMLWEALIAWGIRDEDNTVFTLTQISNACADFAFIDSKTKIMKLRSPLLLDYLRNEAFDDKYHARHIRATFLYLTRSDHEGACKSSQELKERLKAHPFLCYAARTLAPSLATLPSLPYDRDFLKMTTSHRSVDSYLQAAEAWPYIDEESYDEFEAEEERWRCYMKGYTPLHLAAHFGARETLIQSLVDRGDNIEAQAANGQTALHIAAEIGDSSHTVKRLLECGANVAAVDEDGLTPLAHAIVYGCLESVRLLISHGADINALEEEDLVECSREKPDIAEFLVGLGFEMPVEESEPEE